MPSPGAQEKHHQAGRKPRHNQRRSRPPNCLGQYRQPIVAGTDISKRSLAAT
jgi:hypothetical protein